MNTTTEDATQGVSKRTFTAKDFELSAETLELINAIDAVQDLYAQISDALLAANNDFLGGASNALEIAEQQVLPHTEAIVQVLADAIGKQVLAGLNSRGLGQYPIIL